MYHGDNWMSQMREYASHPSYIVTLEGIIIKSNYIWLCLILQHFQGSHKNVFCRENSCWLDWDWIKTSLHIKWSLIFPRLMPSSFMHSRHVVQSLSFETTAFPFFFENTLAGHPPINWSADFSWLNESPI